MDAELARVERALGMHGRYLQGGIMRKWIFALFILMLSAMESQAAPSGTKAFCRSGQTFLTWQEDGSDWYYVYASSTPIEKTEGLTWCAKIPKGSNHFRCLAGGPGNGFQQKTWTELLKGRKWAERIQIEDDPDASKGLPDGTGLFVRTIKKEATTYYAVTSAEGAEATKGGNALAEGVLEKPGTPGATLAFKDQNQHWFVFFTDFEVWNPTRVDEHVEGYAHVFNASIPAKVSDPAPLSVKLHAYTAWKDVFMPYSFPIGDGVTIAMFDYNLTWWFGMVEGLKNIDTKQKAKGERVVNYTEQRLLQAIRWVISNPANFPAKIDPRRVHVFGGSMGGSGTNHISLKNGDLIASSHASKGYTNWAISKKVNPFAKEFRENTWLPDFEGKFGALEDNLPTNLMGGKKVYELLDLKTWVCDPVLETPYIESGQGTLDTVIPFWGVAEYWDALAAGKHPYSAGWDMVDHAGRQDSGSKMNCFQLHRDETLPAMKNASCDSPLRFGVRIKGKIRKIEKDHLVIETPVTHDIRGMTLVLAPSTDTREWFRVKSCEGEVIRVESGDLLAYVPPVTKFQREQMKTRLKRDPTEDELAAAALANKKEYLVIDGDPRGTRNGHITWSSRLQNYDKAGEDDDIVDKEKQWGMNFRLERNGITGDWPQDTATVDITPRRCQEFRPAPGEAVHWENWDFSDKSEPEKIAEGDVVADKYGLVTVEKFAVGKQGLGNRLVISRK
jgi:hypothetical protein